MCSQFLQKKNFGGFLSDLKGIYFEFSGLYIQWNFLVQEAFLKATRIDPEESFKNPGINCEMEYL